MHILYRLVLSILVIYLFVHLSLSLSLPSSLSFYLSIYLCAYTSLCVRTIRMKPNFSAQFDLTSGFKLIILVTLCSSANIGSESRFAYVSGLEAPLLAQRESLRMNSP